MFSIDKHNKIVLTKGDNASLLVEIYNLNKEKYDIQPNDIITLTVRKNQNSATAAITKTANADHYIVFSPQDTSNLTSGMYVYDVQLTTSHGAIYTIVPLSFFIINQEVTNG